MADTAATERDPAFVDIRDNPARQAAREMIVGTGGIILKDYAQVVDYAKHLSRGMQAVNKPLRDQIGMCLCVIDLSTRWGFSAWELARHCYVVNDTLCFDAQVVHALVEKFAPIKYRLRPTYDGEGASRTCTIIGHFKGELGALEYTTPPLGRINPKNSPLWTSDPDQQLFYFATRRWARRYCPDILLGAYAVDDMEDAPPRAGFEHARDVTPAAANLADRLRGEPREGFSGTTIETIDTAIAAASHQEPEATVTAA